MRLRLMAANLTSGNNQSYETAGIDIFKGLKPDVVAIQEFRYNSSSASNDLRTLIDTAFGTDYSFYCESGYNIPNGIVSRYPIIAAGSLDDPTVADRGIAWAQIDLPGTNDLYVISVHLYGSGTATDRNTEAMVVTNFIGTNCPAGSWVYVGGDFNTGSRSEACVTTLKTMLSDNPIPNDNDSTPDQDTNEPRNKPYDYVLPSFALTNYFTPVVLPSHTLTNGLVFDSAVYTPLSDVSPVAFGDSHTTNMQHMGVIKDFLIPTNNAASAAPSISVQPQSQTVQPGSNVTFSVNASGTLPLSYQWFFNSTNILSSLTNSYSVTNVQSTNAGDYTVVITNNFGSTTSSVAVLTVTNLPPSISTQPQNVTVTVGNAAAFSVTAAGANPLAYQWRFNGTNIANATNVSYSIASAQLTNAGNYAVVVTNISGSITSSTATLTVLSTQAVAFAQWNFNSVTPDGSTTTGSTTPSLGSGTASLVGGATASFAGGDSSLDPAGSTDNSGWNTATYPTQGTGNKTRGAQFNVSTAGKQNIVLSWSSQSSNAGSKYYRLQYSTNGVDFIDYPTAFTNGTSFIARTNSLASFAGVSDNANFAFRFMAEFESTAITNANPNYVPVNSASYNTGGTLRYDMVTVSGSTIPPAIAAVLTSPATVSGNQFQFTVTGTAGSNYIVQVSTNLAISNWVSVFTNPSPFTFTDTNINTVSQRFFRAVAP